MKEDKKNIISSLSLIGIAVLFTILVKCVGVLAVGPKLSKIGFANVNLKISQSIGVNNVFKVLSDILVVIPVLMVCAYAFIGVKQLIDRKKLKKVDTQLIALAVFYAVIVLIYIFFEKFVVNYRPILDDGALAASYPSSHTLLAICICGSSILINKYLFKRFKITKLVNKISIVTIVLMVLFRFLSGVHWFTDIIGGILISMAMLKSFDTVLNMLKKR